MKRLITCIDIKSSPDKIWFMLMNFDTYTHWNPFLISIKGTGEPASKLTLTVRPPDMSAMTIKPTVLVNEPGKEFRWKGHLLIPGLFDGEHFFKLEPIDEKTTRFVHGEIFNGILVGLFGKILQKTKLGFEMMNRALKEECEK